MSFYVPECHQKGVKSSSGEKVFSPVSPFPSEGKTEEAKECMIAKGTVKVCLLHFRLEGLRKFATYRIQFQVTVIWLNYRGSLN